MTGLLGPLLSISPGFTLVALGLIAAVLPRALRPVIAVGAPALGLLQLLSMPDGPGGEFTLMGVTVVTFDITAQSFMFGATLLCAALVAGIYSWHERAGLPVTAALLYTGCAVGAVLAGDLPSFFVFFEIASVGAAFLIWSGGTSRSLPAGMRFAVINILAGVLLLEAFLLTYKATGSIAFFTADLSSTAGLYLILALGIKSAFPVLHAWLTDAYPESTPGGTVYLSVFSVSVAIYALIRFMPGEALLVPIGAVMIAFPVFLALLANDLRRVLCYGLISQIGLAVMAIGVGTPLALQAAAILAIANVFGFLLLFMATGAVLYTTGTASAERLGGLASDMPWTALFAIAGALSVASVPVFAGGVAVPPLLTAVSTSGGPWVAALALFGVAGVWAHAGFKVPAAAFFGTRPAALSATGEAPFHMRLAMLIAAAGSLTIGLIPYVDGPGVRADALVTHLQVLAFSLLLFAAARHWKLLPKERDSALIDIDWLYRRLGPAIVTAVMAGTAAAYAAWQRFVAARIAGSMAWLYQAAGPEGGIARTWGTGLGVLWVAVLLVVMLLVSYR